MSRITKELREWVSNHYSGWPSKQAEGYAIADRIDAEHEKVEQDLIDANNQMEQLCECSIEMPVDADGEVWHVGDLAIGFVNQNNPKEVERMLWYGPDSGWQLETDNVIFPCPEHVRHHHANTVEGVLREMCLEIDRRCERGSIDYDKLFAEYASKLRLREDA